VGESDATAHIRQATLTDVDVILDQRRRMFADMGRGDEKAREAMVAATRPLIETGLRDGSYRGWLAEVEGRAVAGGGIAFAAFQPTPTDLSPRRAWIVNVYTEPAFRRRGLARQVLEAILAWCREQGLKAIFLHASDAGRPLYELLGFKPTSEMRLRLE
jgi:GNAT superfamily N-acetyltransferase